MPIIHIIIVLALVGVLMWAIDQYVPMDPPIKRLLHIVVILILVLWLLNIFGVFSGMRDIRIGQHPQSPLSSVSSPPLGVSHAT